MTRSLSDARPLHSEVGWSYRSDGSSKFAYGKQSSAATITGPREVRLRDELTDSATFQVIVAPLDGTSGVSMTALAAELQTLFKSVILLHHHPRSLIQLTVQTMSIPPQPTKTLRLTLDAKEMSETETKRRAPLVLGPDRPFLVSEIASSINASTLALMDANIPLRATVIASSCAILPKSELCAERVMDPNEQESFVIVVDPTPEEEKAAQSLHVLAFAISGYEPMAKDDTGMQLSLVYCSSTGRTTAKQRHYVSELSKKDAMATLASIRSMLENRFE